MSGERFEDASPGEPAVRGVLHRAETGGGDGLVLTHGAGSDHAAPLLVALAEALSAAGMTVLRCDLPYRQARQTGPPPRGAAAADQAGLRRAAQALRPIAPARLFLGGHSYGGRQASMLAAQDAGVADALLLLSYPLHPPDRPAAARTAHLPDLRVPALFVHGAADPFATTEELAAALASIPAPTRMLDLPGAGHDLFHGRRGPRAADAVARIVAAFGAFIEACRA
jgi:predicted alpha/beta-hydrolase family hydrolase